MLIRANNSQQIDSSKSKITLNEPNINATTTSVSNAPTVSSKAPQNRYESIFIKLFAKTTLQMILTFSALFLFVIFFRDLICKHNLFNLNTLCLFSFSLSL